MRQKISKNYTHWLSVIVIGIILGVSLQFVRAWTEPSTSPPNGNVGAPINTGANVQEKGDATHDADICVWSGGVKKCLSIAGGTVTSGIPSGTKDGSCYSIEWTVSGLDGCTDEPPAFCRGTTCLCEGGWTPTIVSYHPVPGTICIDCFTGAIGDPTSTCCSGYAGYLERTYVCVKD